MKILLLGDYSSVHYNLYLGLKECGHDVTLVSSGDGYKEIPTEIKWVTRKSNKVSKLLGINGQSFLEDNNSIVDSFSEYDVVQIINPMIIEETSIKSNRILFERLKKNNNKIFLYSCGDDYNWVSKCLTANPVKYWFSQGAFWFSKELIHPIRYLINPQLSELCKLVYSEVDGIIPGSVDYDWCILDNPRRKNVIPFPIDLSKLAFNVVKNKKCYGITHGKQPGKEIRKGDNYFAEAANAIGDGFSYNQIGGVSFEKYITMISKGDIFFDQVHSCAQGVNALLAMASGKIVFSGFGERFLNCYKIEESTIGIDAKPDVRYLKFMLEKIRAGVFDMEGISVGARKFIESNHDHRVVAERFVGVWKTNELIPS